MQRLVRPALPPRGRAEVTVFSTAVLDRERRRRCAALRWLLEVADAVGFWNSLRRPSINRFGPSAA